MPTLAHAPDHSFAGSTTVEISWNELLNMLTPYVREQGKGDTC